MARARWLWAGTLLRQRLKHLLGNFPPPSNPKHNPISKTTRAFGRYRQCRHYQRYNGSLTLPESLLVRLGDQEIAVI